MKPSVKAIFGALGLAVAAHAAAQVTFYEDNGFHGRNFSTDRPVFDFARAGFNDRASSVVVQGGAWQACEDAGFNGRCVVLRPGQYADLGAMGLNDRISSVRPFQGGGYGSAAPPERYAAADEYQRRPNERIYDVPVTSVHAVIGPPEQRCWVERQQIVGDSGAPNVGGAIAGAVIGGILGHQIGSGRGNDVATAGGAVAGAAIGANVGNGQVVDERDVQRCRTVHGSERPAYWDVTYTFNGQIHHVQTSAPPGPTIAVNAAGEPRV